MLTYVPIFNHLTDSSVWEEPYAVRVLFVTMLAHQDVDHVVRADVYRLHKWAVMPVEEVEKSLEVLSSPDPRRPGQALDGRRIRKVDDGWFIINGQHYQDLMAKINNRWRKARWAAAARAKKAESSQLPYEGLAVAADGRGDTNTAERLAAQASEDLREKREDGTP